MGIATEPPLRREFDLPEEDEEFLQASGLRWETAAVMEGSTRSLWLFIYDYPLPAGYVASGSSSPLLTVTLGVRVTGYPSAALDMVYAHPPVRLSSGRGIACVAEFMLDGRAFQQWSRHYSPTNQFRIGIDNIGTHLGLADEWFRREVLK